LGALYLGDIWKKSVIGRVDGDAGGQAVFVDIERRKRTLWRDIQRVDADGVRLILLLYAAPLSSSLCSV